MPAWIVPYEIPSLTQMKQAAKRWEKSGVWLRQIGQVTLDRVPEEYKSKAVRGLTLTDRSIWLTKKYARRLFRETRKAGLKAHLTETSWRICKRCGRTLIGIDAEERGRLDRTKEGRKQPCSVDCDEAAERRKGHRVKSGVAIKS